MGDALSVPFILFCFMANIYVVYCAVKLVIFQRHGFIFKVKILKEVRFAESLLILLEIRFV